MKRLALALLASTLCLASAGAQIVPPGTNPVPAAGAYNSSPPTLTSGQAGWLQLDSAGNLRISGTVTAGLAGSTSNASSGVATSATNVPTVSYNYGFNGTTWDQLQVDSNKNLLVSAGGAPSLATAQVSVTTGNISVAAARTGRRSVTITNATGTSAIYCGNTGVATTTGTYIGATLGSSTTLNTTAAIFCTVAATTQTVTVAETF